MTRTDALTAAACLRPHYAPGEILVVVNHTRPDRCRLELSCKVLPGSEPRLLKTIDEVFLHLASFKCFGDIDGVDIATES